MASTEYLENEQVRNRGDFSSRSALWNQFGAGAVAVSGLAIVVWVLWWMPFGFDLTDESYYLLWIKQPDLYEFSTSAFGYVYNPVFELLGQNLALFQRLTFLTILTLATATAYLAIGFIQKETGDEADDNDLNRFSRLAISVGIASISTTVYALWLMTPSYNTLAVQALLIVTVGYFLVLTKDGSARPTIGAVALGLGVTVLLLAKPTSAVVAVVVVVAALLASRAFSWKLAILSFASGLIFFLSWSALAMGGPIETLKFFQTGSQGLAALESHSLPKLLNNFKNGLLFEIPDLKFFLLLAVTMALVVISGRILEFTKLVYALLALAAAILVVGAILVNQTRYLIDMSQAGSYYVAIFLGSLLGATAVVLKTRPPSPNGLRALAAIVLMGLLPLAYTFGTNNLPYGALVGASVLCIVGACLAVQWQVSRGIATSGLAITTAVGQLVTVGVVAYGFNYPYRSAVDVASSDIRVSLPGGPDVNTNPSNAAYLTSLNKVATGKGFVSGNALIELTGTQPGAALALGAEPFGAPWLLGGYRGSEDAAEFALTHASCQRAANLWVITSPTSPRAIPTSVLETIGINFQRDYLPAGQVESEYFPGEQTIWKPRRTSTESVRACETARSPK